MENKVVLKGQIKNIRESHKIKDIQFNQADLVVNRKDGKADILTIKFKSLSCPYEDDQYAELTGNIRSYTSHHKDKTSVQLYVFTYFDKPDIAEDTTNYVELDGAICSIDQLRQSATGKHSIRFILANNLNQDSSYKFDNYIPCVIYGKYAQHFANIFKVSDRLHIVGEFHSREYRKYLDNGEMEIRVANEVSVGHCEVL